MALDATTRFIEAVPGGAGDLAILLTDLWQQCSEVWPDLWLPPERFGTELVARFPDSAALHAALPSLRAVDLYLACACAAGCTGAIDAFERAFMPGVVAAIRGMRGDPDVIDELAQQLRERLLVGIDGRGPRIADYAGRGGLRYWLRAIAVRTFLNHKRGANRKVVLSDEPVSTAVAEPALDPELAALRRMYSAQFKSAFQRGIASLDDRQRSLLRYRFLDGLAIDDIAAVYRVHRATMHRWILDARQCVAAATERELRAELDIDADEFRSIRRLVQSQIDLSIPRVLASDD